MEPKATPSVLLELTSLLTELRQAERDVARNLSQTVDAGPAGCVLNQEQERLSEQLSALDQRLRQLLRSSAFSEFAARADFRNDLHDTLQAIEKTHRKVIDLASDQRGAIAETLQQLRYDQRSASLYDRVLRHSL